MDKKRICITLTGRQYQLLQDLADKGVWGHTVTGVSHDIIISKLLGTEKTFEGGLEKAGWNQVYMQGEYDLKDKNKYYLIKTYVYNQVSKHKQQKVKSVE